MTKAKILQARAVELERRATAGAKERGSRTRGTHIAQAIRFTFGREKGGPAEFHRRTGVRVTAFELRAIANLPATALIGGVTDEQRKAAKSSIASAGKARKARFEQRWARGRSAGPGSISVRSVSGGLPGLGRDA